MEVSQKTKNRTIIWPSNSTLGHISEKNKQYFKEISAPQCSQQHYLQLPRYGSNLLSVNSWMDKGTHTHTHTHTHTMEFFSAIKKNEVLPFAATWMDSKGIMLSEISQREKDKYCMISRICGIWKTQQTSE